MERVAMKKIEILGTGCPKCKKLYELAQKAVEEEGIEAEITKVEDIQEIVRRGVIMTPGLIIDGKIISAGKVPSLIELKRMLY
jgi:small redox-active disulfide protein 2